MPDGWEFYSGLNPIVHDSHLDLDNDTISNMHEYDNFLIDSVIFSPTNPDLRLTGDLILLTLYLQLILH